MPRMKMRADKRYQASLYLGRDENGKPLRKYFYGESQKVANAKKQAWIDGQRIASDAFTMTVSRWGKIWLDSYATGGIRNKANTASIISRFAVYIGERTLLADIKQAQIQAYAKAQSVHTKSHVDKVRRTLTSMFKAAVKNDYIGKSPCDDVNWTSTRTGTHEMLEPYLIDLITQNWSIHPAGVWAMFMLYAGLRPSEAFALDRSNITENFITVTDGSHFEHSQLVIVKGQVKSEAGKRDIPVAGPLREVVKALPAEGLVCLSARGKPVSQAAARSNWTAFWNMLEEVYNGRAPRGAGRRSDRFPEDWKYLPKVQMYDLRHTFCSLLYDADVDVKTAQYLMGHASLDMTLKIYTHLSEKKKERSYEKWYKYLGEIDVSIDVKNPEND